ncbi:hypothetical protein [Mesorhizobium temperatum]|uniref:hypothetical protein n=1 Tax=Mesorhizobium temperatum TaxID=241416 RepID=UPI003CC96989
MSAKALVEEFDAETWLMIAWREGTNTELNSRFAAVRLRPIQGLQSARGSRRRVASDRVASRRGRAEQVLALHLRCRSCRRFRTPSVARSTSPARTA